jgi:poly-gamma-glutamate synthesis protein (capsule biosynthesis protein)
MMTAIPSTGNDSQAASERPDLVNRASTDPAPTPRAGSGGDSTITLFLCGDVMTGRGIDQILPYPSNPRLHEPFVKDARDYVLIAEQTNGPIPKPARFSYIWGDALGELDRIRPQLRIINLETTITTSDEHWPGKRIHYRMHPKNVPCLTEAGVDFCSLANNHTLDWGYSGLIETMETLDRANMRFAGAGRNREEAEKPAVFEMGGKGRVIVYALGSTSSGIPSAWAASGDAPGVNLIRGASGAAGRALAEQLEGGKRRNDVLVVSIHWGGNWGYEIPKAHREFAHQLIDRAGVDIIHGHSSHHPRPLEVYKGKLILYGCGDFLNDYEGISGYEEYRDDLTLMYFPRIDPATGDLVELQMTPLQINRFRLQRASRADARWLQHTLNRHSQTFGCRVELKEDNRLYVR